MSDARMLEGSGTLIVENGNYRQLEGTGTATYTDVLLEPFNNFTFAPWVTTGTIVAGRTGNAAQLSSSTNQLADYTIPTINQSDTVTIGFAYRTTSGATSFIVSFRSDAGATEHDYLRRNSDGTLSFVRSSTGLINTAPGTIVTNTWYYLEVQVKLHDTTGAATLKLNGSVLGTFSGDTKNAGTKTVFDTIELSYPGFPGVALYDDLYITMGAGAPFKGDITIP